VLLYNGHKLFWRDQKSVELDFYYHQICDTVEVIAFDPVDFVEMNQLFLRYRPRPNPVIALVTIIITRKLLPATLSLPRAAWSTRVWTTS
jgi:hypothetical protein